VKGGLQYHFFKILDFGHVFLMQIANNILASFRIRRNVDNCIRVGDEDVGAVVSMNET